MPAAKSLTQFAGALALSSTLIRESRTGVDTAAPLLRGRKQNVKAQLAWQQVINNTLMSWLRDPSQLEDEGCDPPSRAILRQSIDLAEVFRDRCYPPPDHVVPDPNGGIVFERRENDEAEVVHIWDDGSTEYIRFKGARLVERGAFWPE